MKSLQFLLCFTILFLAGYAAVQAQMITGVWKGKINQQNVEVKIVQKGDNLAGTAYYYESPDRYRRYSIKGYFDPDTNEAVWWDDELIEDKTRRSSRPGKIPMLSRADFNCPGEGKMMLEGSASVVEKPKEKTGRVDLNKTTGSNFEDEWDFVIGNYTVGANDPEIIDSIALLTQRKPVPGQERPNSLPPAEPEPGEEIKIVREPVTATPQIAFTTEQKFSTRKKTFALEIPVRGDSIELRFYDNAQIDGDSISLFLNNKLIFQNILLSDKAYVIRLDVSTLQEENELVMVAENLGSIPPNTSYMVAIVGEKRYEARLESTEGSSALIRLVRK